MKADEVVIAGGPCAYLEVLIESLQHAGVPGRQVAIHSVNPAARPTWACSAGDEMYVVVLKQVQAAALEVVRRIWRICRNCETILLAEARSCQKCGTPDDRQPGPDPNPPVSVSN